ncbi:hypothetical protein CDL15_Pgr027627 [Punica granatum]|uniref:Uncharacterized protein n=1 Tax=Punica granatum TaxID=22663 RepID=A0A218XJ90_PUNGR|nr:hypothetical protein CDL15_Pgr027627 [Punica granatum]PKI74922.1 hypothetical protein CRG98_004694 [Punica granatum]
MWLRTCSSWWASNEGGLEGSGNVADSRGEESAMVAERSIVKACEEPAMDQAGAGQGGKHHDHQNGKEGGGVFVEAGWQQSEKARVIKGSVESPRN